MADIFVLPTATAQPVMNPPRTGRQGRPPRNVKSLSNFRNEKRWRAKAEALEASNQRYREERAQGAAYAQAEMGSTRASGIHPETWWAGLTDLQRGFVYGYARHAVARTD